MRPSFAGCAPLGVAALALLLSANGYADVLTEHAQVHVQAYGFSATTPLYLLSEAAAGSVDSLEQSGADGNGFSAAGRASVTLRSDALLKATADSYANSPLDIFATAWSRAVWLDAVSYAADPAVDTLRLRFQVDGELAVSYTLNGGFTPIVSRAYLVAFGNGDSFSVPAGPPGTPSAGAGTAVMVEDLSSRLPAANGHRTVVTDDWIGARLERTGVPGYVYTFSGSFEIESHRLTGAGLPADGIFPVVAGIDVVASNRLGPSSLADFFGTVQLTGATDGAGTPIALSRLGFESGLLPIPEPSSWLLILAGLAVLVLARGRDPTSV